MNQYPVDLLCILCCHTPVREIIFRFHSFDIYDDEGKLIVYGRDKKVPYEEYAALKEKLDKGDAPKPFLSNPDSHIRNPPAHNRPHG
mgnify:CR=1 FL=1